MRDRPAGDPGGHARQREVKNYEKKVVRSTRCRGRDIFNKRCQPWASTFSPSGRKLSAGVNGRPAGLEPGLSQNLLAQAVVGRRLAVQVIAPFFSVTAASFAMTSSSPDA